MNTVYTDDQGNTYTILQLCKKVLKEAKEIKGLKLYTHQIRINVDGAIYTCEFINNSSTPYTEINEELANALNTRWLHTRSGFVILFKDILVSSCVLNGDTLDIHGLQVSYRITDTEPTLEAIRLLLVGTVSDTVTLY